MNCWLARYHYDEIKAELFDFFRCRKFPFEKLSYTHESPQDALAKLLKAKRCPQIHYNVRLYCEINDEEACVKVKSISFQTGHHILDTEVL